MTRSPEPDRVRTTETVFQIIETIFRKDEAKLTELANDLGLAKSTLHRHLRTLEELEYLVEEDGYYRIGFKFLQLGEHTRTRLEPFRMAKEKVETLAEQTGERAQFIVEEHGMQVYVFRETGEQAVQTDSGIGKRNPLHATAAGKAILAHLPEERLETIIEEVGLEPITPNTIVSRTVLYDEIEQIRENGFSINDGESTVGLRAIGVPIRYDDESVLGALSVSAPKHRFEAPEMEEYIQQLLLGTANELELNIRYT